MSTDNANKAELDHLFMWTEPNGGTVKARLDELGLLETYRRRHVGQGTANICYCFDNAFLELLWVEDEVQANTSIIAPCQFVERSKNGNPFGIAWRRELLEINTWDFKPPYLPDGLAIKVANDSTDIAQPFMFTFPGSKPPSELAPERKGDLQAKAGFERLELSALILRQETVRAACLDQMLLAGIITTLEEGPADALHLKLKRAPEDARSDVDLVLPF